MANVKILLMFILALSISANATKVGVVVEFPNDAVFTRCVDVERDANAYEILQKSGLRTTWSFHAQYGHGLCAILDTGCPEDNCFCSTEYWNFYIKKPGDGSWGNSQVRFDGGSSCGEHYCAGEGDLLGFTYNVHGEGPREFSFEEICTKKVETVDEPGITGMVTALPTGNLGLISGAVVLLLLISYLVYTR
jgi:hypothetical protein